MTNSISEIEDAKCLLVIGSNPTEAHPIIGEKIIEAKKKGAQLIVIDPRKTQVALFADIHLRPKLGSDIALLNGIMHIIIKEGWHNQEFIRERTEEYGTFEKKIMEYTPERAEKICGVSAEDMTEVAKLYAKSEGAAIFYTLGITEHIRGTHGVLSLANLAMLTGNLGQKSTGVNPLRGQNNVQGACDMGALPNVLSGYQPVSDKNARNKFEQAWKCILPPKPGITEVEMFYAADAGKIKGMYIFGENPLLADPNVNHVKKALSKLDFLVVQDIFLTETAQLAQVVFPGASFAETDGTFTNTERRVQRVRKAIEPVGDSKPNWVIFSLLAKAMGSSVFNYEASEDIFNEIANLTPSYGGMNYDRLNTADSLQWPCPTVEHPGTKYLHQDKFTKGLGTFTPVDFEPPAELPDDEYPLQLITGRNIYHYNTGSMTRNCPHLLAEDSENYAEINPKDANKLGIENGNKVKASSIRGSIEVQARVSERVRQGIIFMPFHFPDSVTNVLTNDALDPIAKTPEYKVCAVSIERI
jgi:formate dehydrogenase alpha subunit